MSFLFQNVRKKDGRLQKFDKRKLTKSIVIAMHMSGVEKPGLAPKVVGHVVSFYKKPVVSSVDIGNAVCSALKKEKHHEICDAYSMVWIRLKQKAKIRSVLKKHGGSEKFSPEKLFKSIQKAFSDSYAEELHSLQPVMREVLSILERKHANKSVSHEEIKDTVEYVLVRRKLNKVAQHYIMFKYR